MTPLYLTLLAIVAFTALGLFIIVCVPDGSQSEPLETEEEWERRQW